MARVLVDFHHSSLLRSLVLLFENRLGIALYRPIGMEWYKEGFWGINDQEDTAKQFLDLDQSYKPSDGTPPLNALRTYTEGDSNGVYMVADPGGITGHAACTLDFFKNNQFDYVVASLPKHVELYKKLIETYQPNAKLLVQVGNNWKLDAYPEMNILASVAPQEGGYQSNVMFYHQEFDLGVFYPEPVPNNKKIYSFVNIIQNTGQGWDDYQALKAALEPQGWEFKAFGGQCPDGNMTGAQALADKMREATFIYHVKPGGDGFGHIIHNAYAVGRPIITRWSHYKDQLAERLSVPGTYIDMDDFGVGETKNILTRLSYDPDELQRMGRLAHSRFTEVVDYGKEAEEIKQWLQNLI